MADQYSITGFAGDPRKNPAIEYGDISTAKGNYIGAAAAGRDTTANDIDTSISDLVSLILLVQSYIADNHTQGLEIMLKSMQHNNLRVKALQKNLAQLSALAADPKKAQEQAKQLKSLQTKLGGHDWVGFDKLAEVAASAPGVYTQAEIEAAKYFTENQAIYAYVEGLPDHDRLLDGILSFSNDLERRFIKMKPEDISKQVDLWVQTIKTQIEHVQNENQASMVQTNFKNQRIDEAWTAMANAVKRDGDSRQGILSKGA